MGRSRPITKAKSVGNPMVQQRRGALSQSFAKRNILSKAKDKAPMAQFSAVPKEMGKAKYKGLPL